MYSNCRPCSRTCTLYSACSITPFSVRALSPLSCVSPYFSKDTVPRVPGSGFRLTPALAEEGQKYSTLGSGFCESRARRNRRAISATDKGKKREEASYISISSQSGVAPRGLVVPHRTTTGSTRPCMFVRRRNKI